MKKYFLVGVWTIFSCSLVACTNISSLSTSESTTALTVTQACNAFAATLNGLSVAKAGGKLSKNAISSVDSAITAANAVCLAKTPPTNGVSVVEEATIALEKVK